MPGRFVTLRKPQRGNSRAYTIARLKRDRPDLAEKVIKREMSAHSAAIEAGFRKKHKPQKWRCPRCGHQMVRG